MLRNYHGVSLKITALDVLHNFYIPHMDVKMDAVPGMPTSFKFTPLVTTADKRVELSSNTDWQVVKEGEDQPRWRNFNYEIACAELCGSGHSSMKYTLIIDTQEDYENWVSALPSKWSQVVNDLKLENGFSEFAPKPVVIPAAKTDTVTVATGDTILITKK